MAAKKQVPFRMSDQDRERITRIRNHFGLPSDAAAVRYAVQRMEEALPPKPRVRGKRA